jgi:hypothetical protein
MQDIDLVSFLAIEYLLQFDQVKIDVCVSFLRIFSRSSRRLSLVVNKTIALTVRCYEHVQKAHVTRGP